jgi:2,3-bisphosphoglycerate-dependent phosphoglycerate mutase
MVSNTCSIYKRKSLISYGFWSWKRRRRGRIFLVIQVVFETHSISEDNERGVASGWLHGRLSPRGRELAHELGDRRRHDGIAAVFSSDLRRAVETAHIAFEGSAIPILLDWRLRECDYGDRNGNPAAEHISTRHHFLDSPYPGGESWRQAISRVGRFLDDLPLRWSDARILIIGHVATRWGLDHHLNGTTLEDLVKRDFAWQEGWEYLAVTG